jgi:hypothetical protein
LPVPNIIPPKVESTTTNVNPTGPCPVTCVEPAVTGSSLKAGRRVISAPTGVGTRLENKGLWVGLGVGLLQATNSQTANNNHDIAFFISTPSMSVRLISSREELPGHRAALLY